MYVACRQLKVSVPGVDGKTKVTVISPGQPVPGAEGWPYPNLIAHLNLNLIKWNGQTEIEAPHNAHKRMGNVIPAIFRKMAPKPYEAPQSFQPDAPHTKAEDPVQEVKTLGPVPSKPNACTQCEGKEFKSLAGLIAHQRAKHPQKDSQTKAG